MPSSANNAAEGHSPDIAYSWQKLRNGKVIQPHDLTFIYHESYEYALMKSGLSYDESHNQADGYYNHSKEVREWVERGDK